MLRRFLQNKDGNIAMMFCLCIVPIFMGCLAAYDVLLQHRTITNTERIMEELALGLNQRARRHDKRRLYAEDRKVMRDLEIFGTGFLQMNLNQLKGVKTFKADVKVRMNGKKMRVNPGVEITTRTYLLRYGDMNKLTVTELNIKK